MIRKSKKDFIYGVTPASGMLLMVFGVALVTPMTTEKPEGILKTYFFVVEQKRN